MSIFTTAGKHVLLGAIAGAGWYIAPFNGQPGNGGTELSSSTTEGRIALNSSNLAAPAAGEVQNDATIEWEATSSITVTHVGVYSAVSGGNLMAWDSIDSAELLNGQRLTINPTNLAFILGDPA